MKTTLGIIAGKGSLPEQIIDACREIYRPFFVLSFEGDSVSEMIKTVPHAVVRIGAVGAALEHLRGAGVQEIVMAGGIKRPSLTSLKPDEKGAALLKKLGKAFFFGDDALLKAVTSFFEEEGFSVVGVDSILPILAEEGVLGKVAPDEKQRADIMIGMVAAKNLGALDIGQAVIVENNLVIGQEDSFGTDALIERAVSARSGISKSGVLVKAKKPGQEERVDLPSIGVNTIEKLHAGGFAGVAVEAQGSLLIDKKLLIKKADEYGLFVVGVKYE